MSYMKKVLQNHLKITNKKKIGRMKRLQPPIKIERQYLRKMFPILELVHQQVKDVLVPRLKNLADQHYSARSLIEKGKRADAAADDVIDIIEGMGLKITDEFTKPELIRIATDMGMAVSDYNLEQLSGELKRLVNIDLFLPDEYLKDEIASFVVGNVQLIQNLSDDVLDKVQGAVLEGFRTGARWEDIADDILDISDPEDGIGRSRADFIARDQINKLNGQLNQLRQTDLGLERYTWRTTLDERVRPNHRSKEGKIYSWDDPPADTGAPGDDYNCRCWAEPVLDDLLDQQPEGAPEDDGSDDE